MTLPAIERATINGPAGPLEAIIEDAQTGNEPESRYAVVCHPHPLFGGTMDNKVVTTLARAMHEAGIPTLRFNFRGVGKSAGAFDGGMGETADAVAVAAAGALRWPGRKLVIAGFSFGAYVALRLAQELDATRLITVAPPVDRFDFSGLEAPACPWLVVQGDADDVVDPHSVIHWVSSLNPRPQLVVMPGVGHFFHGRLHELRDAARGAVIDAVRGG
jgi:alpha/beta superfamily hydrolase